MADENAEFRIWRDHRATRVEVIRDGYMLLAQIVACAGCERHLALCLAALVEDGTVDLGRLEAAFELARPVAKEHVAREGGSDG